MFKFTPRLKVKVKPNFLLKQEMLATKITNEDIRADHQMQRLGRHIPQQSIFKVRPLLCLTQEQNSLFTFSDILIPLAELCLYLSIPNLNLNAVLLRASKFEEPFQLKKNYAFLILNKTPNSISTHALLYFKATSHKFYLKLNWKKREFTHLPEVCCDTPGNNGLFPLCYTLTFAPHFISFAQIQPAFSP